MFRVERAVEGRPVDLLTIHQVSSIEPTLDEAGRVNYQVLLHPAVRRAHLI